MRDKKPLILVLASTFPRWKNDKEPRFVFDLCQYLKNDYEIIVLAPHYLASKTNEIFDGLNVIRYRYGPEKFQILAYEGGITSKLKNNRFNWLMLPLFFLGQWIAILKIIRKHPVKAIHAHWLIPQGILAITARFFSKNKPPILCTSHGGDLYGLNDAFSNAIKRFVINNVECLTVVSKAMQKEVIKLMPNAKLPGVAPMGTNLQKLFTPDEFVQRSSNQLLFVGRLVEKKGLKYLLNALPEIIKSHPQLILNIAGTGPEQKALESQIEKLGIKNHVHFLGRLSHEQLVIQYRQATMAVFPFVEATDGDQEGLGLVMVEALGCKCPIIASNIPAVYDVIIDGETGVLVQAASSERLANQIAHLLESPVLREKLALQGHRYVKDKFDWGNIGHNYSGIIKQLIDSTAIH